MITSTSGLSHARISIAPSKVDNTTSGVPLVEKRFSSRSTYLLKSALTRSMHPGPASRTAREPTTNAERKAMTKASRRLDDRSELQVLSRKVLVLGSRVHELSSDVSLDHGKHRVQNDEVGGSLWREHTVTDEPELARRRRRAKRHGVDDRETDPPHQRLKRALHRQGAAGEGPIVEQRGRRAGGDRLAAKPCARTDG